MMLMSLRPIATGTTTRPSIVILVHVGFLSLIAFRMQLFIRVLVVLFTQVLVLMEL